MSKIAIVGAGLAGLVTARELVAEHHVTVFEKSRGAGGRLATRYSDDGEFDHGAQFFKARSRAFRAWLQPLIDDGAVATWSAGFAEFEGSHIQLTREWNEDPPHYVGTPRMSNIGKWLAADLDLRLETTIAVVNQSNQGWRLTNSDGVSYGPFDWVVCTAPAVQTSALLAASARIRQLGEAARMSGCYTVMLAFEQPLSLPFQAALVRGADISWISVNSSKPGRADRYCLVVHSTNAWADDHIDDDKDSVTTHLLDQTAQVTGVALDSASYCRLHRWRYANIAPRNGPEYCIDESLSLATCGDWLVRGNVEAAFKSASALSRELKRLL